MQVFDDCALTDAVRDETYKCYPEAKRAHLKTGGNFPFLSRSAEVNLYLQVSRRIVISKDRYSVPGWGGIGIGFFGRLLLLT